MTTKNTAYKPFNLGQIVATRGVMDTVPGERLLQSLMATQNPPPVATSKSPTKQA